MSVLYFIWLLSACYLLFHYLWFHGKLAWYKAPVDDPDFDKPVSILICARNEAVNLRKNLPLILDQNYFEYEVLVVNDRSMDNTEEVLNELQQKHVHLRFLSLSGKKTTAGKKEALQFAIENARFDYLLLTDADSRPGGNLWLRLMSRHFRDAEIVLGVSPYNNKGNVASWLTVTETVFTAQQYLSFALAGNTYMGVGRNLAYRKEVFEKSTGFQNHLHLPSGDDDLFISENGKQRQVAIELHEESFTWSAPPLNFKSWWQQKRRHLSTSYSYKPAVKVLLALYGAAQLLFYILAIPLCFHPEAYPGFVVFFVSKFVIQWVMLQRLGTSFSKNGSWILFPLMEFPVVLLLFLVHLTNMFSGLSKKW